MNSFICVYTIKDSKSRQKGVWRVCPVCSIGYHGTHCKKKLPITQIYGAEGHRGVPCPELCANLGASTGVSGDKGNQFFLFASTSV